MSQCTCTKDAQMTCIVHPTEQTLKARIKELEAVLDVISEESAEHWIRVKAFDALRGI